MAVFGVVFEFARVYGAIGICVGSLAVYAVLMILAGIYGAIRRGKGAQAVVFPIFKISLITGAVSICEVPFAMVSAVNIITFINRTVYKVEGAFAMVFPIFKITLVAGAIRKGPDPGPIIAVALNATGLFCIRCFGKQQNWQHEKNNQSPLHDSSRVCLVGLKFFGFKGLHRYPLAGTDKVR